MASFRLLTVLALLTYCVNTYSQRPPSPNTDKLDREDLYDPYNTKSSYDVKIDCENDIKIEASEYDISTIFPPIASALSDCVPIDTRGQSLVTYTLQDRDAVQAIRKNLQNRSNSFCFYIDWEIKGGVFILDNGKRVTKMRFGDQTLGGAMSCGFGGSNEGAAHVTYDPYGNFITTSLRIQWDNIASSNRPNVSIKFTLESSESVKIKFKPKGGLIFEEVTIGVKNKNKHVVCQEKLYLGNDIYNISNIRAEQSCGSKTATIHVTNGTAYDGCLKNGIQYTYGYTYTINGNAPSKEKYATNNQFTISDINPEDAVNVTVTPYYAITEYGGFRGLARQLSFGGNKTSYYTDIPGVLCNDIVGGDRQPFFVHGLTNPTWTFFPNYLNSSTYVTVRGNEVMWNKLPPPGRYAVQIRGQDNSCSDPVLITRYFDVDVCESHGLPDQDDALYHNASSNGLNNLANSKSTTLTNSLHSDNTASDWHTPEYKIYPTLANFGQNIFIRRTAEGLTSNASKVCVYNAIGKLLFTIKLNTASITTVPTTHLERGTYLISITVDEFETPYVRRFVVN